MKISRSSRFGAAFTLIELLVVISIIAVLAGLGFSAMQGAQLAAKKAAAKNDMSHLCGAIQTYYTEYGRYPIDSTTVTTDKAAVYGNPTLGNDRIVSVLRYQASPNVTQTTIDALNPRQIKFLEVSNVKSSSLPISGIQTVSGALAGTVPGAWYDPWGSQYIIFIDADYGGTIDWSAVYTSIGSDTTLISQISVGVACIGLYDFKTPPNDQSLVPPHAFNRQYDLINWQ
jgi:prepilin-type N-terminal cleavage/methylation domain-containing protein